MADGAREICNGTPGYNWARFVEWEILTTLGQKADNLDLIPCFDKHILYMLGNDGAEEHNGGHCLQGHMEFWISFFFLLKPIIYRL